MRWILIRHGKTQGNLEHRYIGCQTDEPLCAQGVAELRAKQYPPVKHVFVSPMKRCIETAQLLFPNARIDVIDGFRECDFGEFENKNYAELNGRTDYQAWIDSNGEMPFPGGESRAEFAAHCVKAFDELMKRDLREDCAVIAHGGTIMAIMESYANTRGNYYDYQVKNGEGFILNDDGSYQLLSFANRIAADD